MPTNAQGGRRLADKTALITGASRGIGRAIATQFAVQGADLFLCATGLEKLRETQANVSGFGGRTELAVADVSESDEVERLFEAAVSAFGRIDIVVNNAGIYKPAKFLDYTPEVFDRIMRVNAYGVFHVMQRAVRHMVGNGAGKIVNIASTAGKWESPNQSAYNASKHAVVGLTRCVALETAAHGINVNAICPGFVETDMMAELQTHAEILDVSIDQLRQGLLTRIPMGRLLQPEEIAHLAVYLASSESDGMTGQALPISGGMRMG